MEILKLEMDEIIKELKMETGYGIQKYKWSQEYARRLYNHSVGNILFCFTTSKTTVIKTLV